MSAEGGPGGGNGGTGGLSGTGGLGGEAGIGAGAGSVGIATETGAGTLSPAVSISSPNTEQSIGLSRINGKSGGAFNKSAFVTDIFSAPEYQISQGAFNPDTATPNNHFIKIPAEAALSNAIDTAIQDALEDSNVKTDTQVTDIKETTTIINDVGYSLAPDKAPVKDSLSTAKEPEIVQEAKSAFPKMAKNEPMQKAKAVFREYAAKYILPYISETPTPDENEPETAPKAGSLLKVVNEEFQLAPQEIAEENKKENLKLNVKDQVELMTDVEQAVKTRELYIAIGYQTDAATALAIHALHQTLARKRLEVKVADQVKNAAETLQKTKDRPVTKTELAPLVDEETRIEVNKKIREIEPPRKIYKIKDKKAESARLEGLDQALNQVATIKKLKQEDSSENSKITGKEVVDIMAANETNRQRSRIVQPMGTDWSLPGDDGVYIEGSNLKTAEPDKIRQEIIAIMDRKPPVELTDIKTSQEVTERDVERVVRRREIRPKAVEIFNASRQTPA